MRKVRQRHDGKTVYSLRSEHERYRSFYTSHGDINISVKML